jgi:hypothetical protein
MIPILSKIFHKYHAIHWDIVSGRRDLLIDLPFTTRAKLWGQVCYFLYKKEEPIFYFELCRFYEDEYVKR